MDTPKVGSDRAGMLERYHAATGLEPIEVPEADAEQSDANLDAAKPASQSEAHPEGEHAEAEPKKPVAKEVVVSDPGVKAKVEKQEDTTTVPLAALHEEREKRKAKTLEARQLQDQLSAKDQELNDVKARLASVEDTIRKAQAGDSGDVTDEEKVKLVEENKTLKAAQVKVEQERQIQSKKDAEAETNRLIVTADATLTKEGFPGFQRFGKDVYDAIVAKIKSGDIEEKDVTTDMWAQVYKEEVYPKIKAVFADSVKADKAAAIAAKKKAANLVGNPGAGPTPKDEDNLDAPQTADSYMKVRKTIK